MHRLKKKRSFFDFFGEKIQNRHRMEVQKILENRSKIVDICDTCEQIQHDIVDGEMPCNNKNCVFYKIAQDYLKELNDCVEQAYKKKNS